MKGSAKNSAETKENKSIDKSKPFTPQFDHTANKEPGYISILKAEAEKYNGFYVGSLPPSNNPFIKF